MSCAISAELVVLSFDAMTKAELLSGLTVSEHRLRSQRTPQTRSATKTHRASQICWPQLSPTVWLKSFSSSCEKGR